MIINFMITVVVKRDPENLLVLIHLHLDNNYNEREQEQ